MNILESMNSNIKRKLVIDRLELNFIGCIVLIVKIMNDLELLSFYF
jgi:hypothetical protein